MRNKYHNRKITRDGETFDSLKEYRRFCELKLLLRAKKISDLQRQVKFVLIPTQREPGEIGVRGGVKKGRIIEQECSYIADFVYVNDKGEKVLSIPLIDYALLVKGHYNRNMDNQEYLDRQDEYNMTFFLDEGEWMSSVILINSWRVVINEEDI